MIGKKRSGFQITSVTLDYDEESKEMENGEVELVNGVPGHVGSGSASVPGRADVARPGKTVSPLAADSSLVSRAGARLPDSPASPQGPQRADGAGNAATLLRAVPPRTEASPKSPPRAGGASQQAGGMCSSRFRVVKLDHASGEPYHRGRWTCTDLRDRELLGHVLTRVLDGGRHIGSLDSRLDLGGLAHQAVGQLEPKLQAPKSHGSPPVLSPGKASGGHPFAPGDGTLNVFLLQAAKRLNLSETVRPGPAMSPRFSGHAPAGGGGVAVSAPGSIVASVPGSTSSSAPGSISASIPGSTPGSAPGSISASFPGSTPGSAPASTSASVPGSTPGSTPGSAPGSISASIPGSTADPGSTPGSVPGSTADPGSTNGSVPGSIAASVPGSTPVSAPGSTTGSTDALAPGATAAAIFVPSSIAALGSTGTTTTPGVTAATAVPISATGRGFATAPGSTAVPASSAPPGSIAAACTPSFGTTAAPRSGSATAAPKPCSTISSPKPGSSRPGSTTTLAKETAVPKSGAHLLTAMPKEHQKPAAVHLQGFEGEHVDRNPSNPISLSVSRPSSGEHGAIKKFSEPRSTPASPAPLSRNNSPTRKTLPSKVNGASSLRLISPMQTLATSMLSVGSHHDGEDESGSSSGMVAIDNKIEQAMDLVKSHLMYAVREEVEVLREQIKELIDRNSLLERENALLKSLVSSEQLSQIQGPSRTPGGSGGSSSTA